MDFEAVCTPTWADVDRYKRLRALGRDLNQRIVETIPREMIPRVADALGILQKGVLVFETEDSAGVLMDSCLYDWPVEGKSLVGRFAGTHAFPAGSDEHELLRASLRAEYRLLVPDAVREGVGVYFLDAFSGDPFFVMDMGLGQSRNLDPKVLFASRIVPLGGYWMTGGAGLPLLPQVRQNLYRRLEAEGVLVDGKITDRRRLARMAVRACLKSGVAGRVRYEDPESPEQGNGPAGYPQPRRRFAAPGRNDPCPCGSGRKYKRCCQAQGG
jgi:hypothetical protein